MEDRAWPMLHYQAQVSADGAAWTDLPTVSGSVSLSTPSVCHAVPGAPGVFIRIALSMAPASGGGGLDGRPDADLPPGAR